MDNSAPPLVQTAQYCRNARNHHCSDASSYTGWYADDPKLLERIAQFENMTTADPDNEMAFFSLGNAYLKANRAAEAASSFERVTVLNPDMSKAWQLAGEAMIAAVPCPRGRRPNTLSQQTLRVSIGGVGWGDTSSLRWGGAQKTPRWGG